MQDLMLISMPGGGELIIILVIVLLLFGAKRIPEIASGMGRGLREFKKSVRDVQSEVDAAGKNATIDEQPAQKQQKSEPDNKK